VPAQQAECSKVEDHVHPGGQRVRDRPVAAGVDEVLQARLHEQTGFDGAAVRQLQGHLPILHPNGGVGAIERFREALDLDPKYAKAQTGLGNALIETGRQAEAIDPFRQAASLDPTNAKARYNLALTLARSGRGDEANEPFERALRDLAGVRVRAPSPDCRTKNAGNGRISGPTWTRCSAATARRNDLRTRG
jgi:thioredoxin-like negative regulator of GroEL